MPHSPRASRAEIFEHLRRLVGSEAESVIAQTLTLLKDGKNSQAEQCLADFDATLGGTGLHCQPLNYKLSGVYRPLTYVSMAFRQSQPDLLSRHLIQATCAHAENVLKESIRLGLIAKIFDNYPMGRMLRHGFKKRIPDQLYDDLLWLNDGINIHVKHDYAPPQDYPEGEPLDSHLFGIDEALAIYLIARCLVVELETIYRHNL